MANLKETLDKHPIAAALGLLISGFLAGLGTYEGALKLTGAQVVPRSMRVADAEQVILSKPEHDSLLIKSSKSLPLEAKLKESETQATNLQRNIVLADQKNEFFVRSLRYARARVDLLHLPGRTGQDLDEAEKVLKATRLAYVNLIHAWFSGQTKFQGDRNWLQARILRKGSNQNDGEIKFRGESTSWRIPPEIKEAVHERPL